jgi:hypothetical protein
MLAIKGLQDSWKLFPELAGGLLEAGADAADRGAGVRRQRKISGKPGRAERT